MSWFSSLFTQPPPPPFVVYDTNAHLQTLTPTWNEPSEESNKKYVAISRDTKEVYLEAALLAKTIGVAEGVLLSKNSKELETLVNNHNFLIGSIKQVCISAKDSYPDLQLSSLLPFTINRLGQDLGKLKQLIECVGALRQQMMEQRRSYAENLDSGLLILMGAIYISEAKLSSGRSTQPGALISLSGDRFKRVEERSLKENLRRISFFQEQQIPNITRLMLAASEPPLALVHWLDGNGSVFVGDLTIHPLQLCHVLLDAAKALAAMHQLNPALVYRQIRPENIQFQGNLKAIPTEKRAKGTLNCVPLEEQPGSIHYRAPERLQPSSLPAPGEDPREDPGEDLFAFGATMLDMAFGITKLKADQLGKAKSGCEIQYRINTIHRALFKACLLPSDGPLLKQLNLQDALDPTHAFIRIQLLLIAASLMRHSPKERISMQSVVDQLEKLVERFSRGSFPVIYSFEYGMEDVEEKEKAVREEMIVSATRMGIEKEQVKNIISTEEILQLMTSLTEVYESGKTVWPTLELSQLAKVTTQQLGKNTEKLGELLARASRARGLLSTEADPASFAYIGKIKKGDPHPSLIVRDGTIYVGGAKIAQGVNVKVSTLEPLSSNNQPFVKLVARGKAVQYFQKSLDMAKELQEKRVPNICVYPLQKLSKTKGSQSKLIVLASRQDDGCDLQNQSASDICQVLIDVCEALAFMHKLPEPMVHGDVKPHNIGIPKLEPTQSVHGLLMDFEGTAKAGELATTLTEDYMAREANIGLPLSPEQDIFSFGVTVADMAGNVEDPKYFSEAQSDDEIIQRLKEIQKELLAQSYEAKDKLLRLRLLDIAKFSISVFPRNRKPLDHTLRSLKSALEQYFAESDNTVAEKLLEVTAKLA